MLLNYLLAILSTILFVAFGVLLVIGFIVASGFWVLWLVLIFVLVCLYGGVMIYLLDAEYVII